MHDDASIRAVHRARRTQYVAWVVTALLLLFSLMAFAGSHRHHRLMRALERQQALAEMGEMAAVLAHEIRNPVGIIKGRAQILLEEDQPVPPTALRSLVDQSQRLEQLINTRRRKGTPRDEAIAKAGQLRMRPILLTSVTTIAGLLPMSLGWFGDSGGLAPMATAIAWGLMFATVLTLFIVPSAYAIIDDLVNAVYRLFGRTRKVSDDLEEEAELDALDRLPVREAADSVNPPQSQSQAPSHV